MGNQTPNTGFVTCFAREKTTNSLSDRIELNSCLLKRELNDLYQNGSLNKGQQSLFV